jgi:hypothetical protein
MLLVNLLPVISLVTVLFTGSIQQDLARYSVGPEGHQIGILAEAGQRIQPSSVGGHSAGSAVIPGATNYATSLALPMGGDVEVAVSVPAAPVASAHTHWIINDYFNNDPERRTTWHGTPADLGVRHCNTPAGSCPGYVGGLQVFRNHILYNVTLASSSSQTAWAVLKSIRIPAGG